MIKKRVLIFYIITILFSAMFFSYSLVFALPSKTNETNYNIIKNSNNIFLDSVSLNSNLVFIDNDFVDFEITGDCSLFGKYLGKKGNYNIFQIKVLDDKCDKDRITADFNFDGQIKEEQFNLITAYNLYSVHLDRTTQDLEEIVKNLETQISEKSDNISDNFILNLKEDRKIDEISYIKDFLNDILEKRLQKYKIPVIGTELPTRFTKMPNSGRSYRESYTDNLHHGWDFDGDKGTPVVSLDDAIVVRVIKGFTFGDLGKIDYSEDLSDEQRKENLNLLRGNQVWLKTMKGDVVFYSHLSEVFDDIEEGDFVSKGQPLGLIGATGVPDKDYSDYHLHLPIQKNPHIEEKIGKNTYMDYMKWDWALKGQSYEETMKNQYDIFE